MVTSGEQATDGTWAAGQDGILTTFVANNDGITTNPRWYSKTDEKVNLSKVVKPKTDN